MNPAPDAELASVGEYNHNWVVNNVADFILKRLQEQTAPTQTYRWDSLLNGNSAPTNSASVEGFQPSTIEAKKASKPRTPRAKKNETETPVEAKKPRAKKATFE
jgi:hypothetical protein